MHPFRRYISGPSLWLLASAAICSLSPARAAAQTAALRRSWTTFSTGFGPAMASMRGDTVYEGSGQAYASVRYTRPLTLRRAFEIELIGGHSFAAGDCIPGFSICAPAFDFVGASSNVVASLGSRVGPDAFLGSLGVGLYRVSPTESHAVSPRPAVGAQGGIEVPLITGAHATLALGVRGLIFPLVHGQTLGLGLLAASLRTW